MYDHHHSVVSRIIDLLDAHNCWFEKFEHKPVRTSQEAAEIRTGYSLEQGAKALIVRVKISNSQKFFAMLVLSGDHKFDSKKVKHHFGAKDIRFATEQEVAELTGGVEPGGVPPFGTLFELPVVVDVQLLAHEKIIFNAGDKRVSVAVRTVDYLKLVQPTQTTLV